ncbi:MAG: hypothetical protein IJ588_06130 [Prevotella sp.]|nr:hypothetical protein [Prevotella sp.]
MKRIMITRLVLAVAALLLTACSSEEAQAQTTSSDMKINITIEGKTLPVTLVDNEATRTLMAALQQSAITYEADDYGGFEKVGALGRSLPTSNQQITTAAGDVILYSGNQIVLFYGSNSWSYTRLGRIEYQSTDELKTFLKAGQGRISVTLSVPESTGIAPVSAAKQDDKSYTLNGTALKQEPTRGVFVKNGKKYIK